jgi:hypothetical protein
MHNQLDPVHGNTRSRTASVVATLAIAASLAMGVPRIGQAQNAVTDWVGIVQPAIHNASAPRPPGSAEILHTIVHLAVYDAVVAIEGGYEPYAAAIDAPAGADLGAAIATAAYRAARGRVAAAQFAYLDGAYASYMAGIPDGQAKSDGVAVGEAAAAAMLALRASDGFNNVVVYECSAVPPPYAEFEPDGGCGTQPIDSKVAQITPFTFSDPARYRLHGPDRFRSRAWVRDFDETKDYGRSNSSVRTAEQTDIVYFWAEHAYVHWNRNLNHLAIAKGPGHGPSVCAGPHRGVRARRWQPLRRLVFHDQRPAGPHLGDPAELRGTDASLRRITTSANSRNRALDPGKVP